MENLEGLLDPAVVQVVGKVCAEPQSTPDSNLVPTSYKLSQRLGSQERAAIVRHYCEGHSSRETARRFDVGKTAVLEVLREEGIRPRPPHRKQIDPIPLTGSLRQSEPPDTRSVGELDSRRV